MTTRGHLGCLSKEGQVQSNRPRGHFQGESTGKQAESQWLGRGGGNVMVPKVGVNQR